jgi:hypothetical protein
MTLSAVVDTSVARSDEAGASLGRRIRESFPGERLVILFASPRCDFPPLLQVLDAECRPRALVGCSSAGEFTTNVNGEGMACAVATRLRMGREFDFELDAVRATLGDAQFAGCNSIGQIARSEGQMSGFHDCTAVVCVIPE